MLSLNSILKVGRMMQQTGGQNPEHSNDAPSALQSLSEAEVAARLARGEKVARVNIQHIITASGDVTLFNVEHPLPEGARLADEKESI